MAWVLNCSKNYFEKEKYLPLFSFQFQQLSQVATRTIDTSPTSITYTELLQTMSKLFMN